MTPDQLPLKDIHLPEPVGWWPPAPGWWLLVAGMAALTLVAWLAARASRRGRLKRQALEALHGISQSYAADGDTQQLCQALSVLLRRISVSVFPRTRVASLTGEKWLAFLQQGLPDDREQAFLTGPGRALAEAPYNPKLGVEADQLLETCRRWIIANTRQERSP